LQLRDHLRIRIVAIIYWQSIVLPGGRTASFAFEYFRRAIIEFAKVALSVALFAFVRHERNFFFALLEVSRGKKNTHAQTWDFVEKEKSRSGLVV
jgi:hypothetical protein